MCGRYTLSATPAELESRFQAELTDEFSPKYNCAPGQHLPVITNQDSSTFQQSKWGLIAPWADTPTDGVINARAETVNKKPLFKDAYTARRCIVPADGFYEWAETETGKQPYRVAFEDDRLFAMAGLYETWESSHTQTGLGDFTSDKKVDNSPDRVHSFTIITTEPNQTVSPLHHRMAAVLQPEHESMWLDGTSEDLKDILNPHPSRDWHAYPVSDRVNSPANDDPELITPEPSA